MDNRVNILGVNFNNVTMVQAVEKALKLIDNGVHYICTPNPEIVMLAQKDKELMEILNHADLVLPDGIGIVIGSKILNEPIKERVTGFEFVNELFKSDKAFYFFGGKPGIADKAAEELRKKFKDINIVGTRNGYFTDDSEIIEDIKAKKPDILLVCLGAPKQEKWIYKNKDSLGVPLLLGVGGSLDGISGEVKRAPDIWIKLNLEWLYRIIKQPSRLPRAMALPKFIIKVLFGGNKNEG